MVRVPAAGAACDHLASAAPQGGSPQEDEKRIMRRLSPIGLVAVAALVIGAPATAVSVAGYLSTPMGDQPVTNPQIRIVSPVSDLARIHRGQPIVIRAAWKDFDYRPDLRTPNAGSSLGSESQVVVDGVVQGHAHAYLQPVNTDGSIASASPVSFCVLTTIVSEDGNDGIAEGTCPAVPRGVYRLSVELQTNAHVAILKNGPQAVPSSDTVTIRVP